MNIGDEFILINERNGKRERFLRTECPICNKVRDVKKRNRFASSKTLCCTCNRKNHRALYSLYRGNVLP